MMPTGYTAELYDGKPQSFEDFALHCARAFGALIHMRDDDFNAPIRPDTNSDYHEKKLREAKIKEHWLHMLTQKECDAQALREYDENVARYNELARNRKALRVRYENMLAKVENWEPPTPDHEGLKKFMIEQLTTSIDGDCDMTYVSVPVLKTGEQWLEEQLASVAHDIEYHSKESKEEEDRVNDRNEWVQKLQDSLK